MVGRSSPLKGLHSHSLVLPVEAAIQGSQVLHAALLFQEGHCQGYDSLVTCMIELLPIRFHPCNDAGGVVVFFAPITLHSPSLGYRVGWWQ